MQKFTVLGLSRINQRCRFHQFHAIGSHHVEKTKATFAAKIEKGLGDDGYGNPIKISPENKTIATAAGDLPISPIMDPAWMEATRRYRIPKPKAWRSTTTGRFRKKLFLNPWAQALATSWRHCALTHVSVPRYFLQDFKLVAHPETGVPWWTPGELSEDTLRCESMEAKQGEITDPREDGWEFSSVKDADASPEMPTTATDPADLASGIEALTPQRASADAPVGYTLAQKALVQTLTGEGPSGTRLGGPMSLILRRPRFSDSRFLRKIVWRADMDEVVLDLMRRRIVGTLLYLLRLSKKDGRSYLTACDDWDMAKALKHRGCVLWFGSDVSDQRDIVNGNSIDSSGSSPEHCQLGAGGPQPFATLDLPDSKYEKKIPVHNVPQLLGEEQLQILRQIPLFRDNSLLMLGKQRTIPLQLALWKLQGYLEEYKFNV